MDQLLVHQIALWVAILTMPLFNLMYVKELFRPKRRPNGKVDWMDLLLTAGIAFWLGYIIVTSIAPAFAYHVMGIAQEIPARFRISPAWDIAFLSAITLWLVARFWFWLRSEKIKESWQKGNKLCGL